MSCKVCIMTFLEPALDSTIFFRYPQKPYLRDSIYCGIYGFPNIALVEAATLNCCILYIPLLLLTKMFLEVVSWKVQFLLYIVFHNTKNKNGLAQNSNPTSYFQQVGHLIKILSTNAHALSLHVSWKLLQYQSLEATLPLMIGETMDRCKGSSWCC